MRTCLHMDPTTVDARKNADPCTSTLHFLIYEGLTRINSKGEGELAIAESVEISENGKIYLFRLRDAYWSDGTPITARDFEYSWKKILTPAFAAPCPYLLYAIKNAEKACQGLISPDEVGVKALDEKTLRIELENPTPYFLSLITFCNFYPIPSHIEMKNPSWDFSQDVIVSGPFLLDTWERNKEIILKKNLTYWDAKNVHLDEIRFSIIPQDRTAMQMFERGELDFLATPTSPLTIEDLAYCKQKKILQIHPLGGLLFCTFNLDCFPFQNSDIRKALSYAIDRPSIVENILQLSESPATRFIPPVIVNNQNRKLMPAYDPKLAQKHLEKGLKDLGIERGAVSDALVLTYEDTDIPSQTAQTIQQQWKKVLGLDAKLLESNRKTLMSNLMGKNYAVGIEHIHVQYTDPTNILERFKYKHGAKNLPGFEHSEYIRLLNEAAEKNNPVERLQILDRAEEVLASEMPFTPIFHFNQGILMSPSYENVEFSPVGNLLFKNLIKKQ